MEFLIPLFIVLVVGLIAFGAYQAAKRRKELTAWAHQNGWSFDPSKDRRFDEWYGAFDCLCRGSNRYAYNIVRGKRNDRSLIACDYHYETYSTDSKGRRRTNHHRFSVVMLETNLPLRQLLIRPEGMFDKVAGFFGFDDIDFELDAFSREFYVRSPDRQWAYDVIHQETMEYLLQSPRFTIEMQGPIVMMRSRGRFSVSQFQQAIGVGEGVIERLPNYLLQELQGVEQWTRD